MKRNWSRAIAVLFLVAATLPFAACKKKPPTTTESARPTEAPSAPPETRVTPPPAPPPPIVREDLPRDVEGLNRAGYLKDIFFDYNQADLRDDARATLSANADWQALPASWRND